MPSSDAIIIGESWISEHYFGTDAKSQSFTARVIERRRQWDETAATGGSTARSRFIAARSTLETDLASLSADTSDHDRAHALAVQLLLILGYMGSGIVLEHHGPVARVTTPGLSDESAVVIIDAKPAASLEDILEKQGTTLSSPYTASDATELTSVARTLTSLMVDDDGPRFALVLAGRWALVVERERWLEGRYLAVDLQLIAQRNDDRRGGEIDRALAAMEAQSLVPAIDTGEIWWSAVLDESIKHTIGVSQDLRDGVRESIEIIANDVVQRRSAEALPALPASEAQVLATQSLRFLYRILFLLYAEASPELGVLPVGASEYEQGYSLDRLRDLTLVELATPRARTGRHFYESLSRLFHFVEHGHTPPHQPSDTARVSEASSELAEQGVGQSVLDDGLTFHSLRADLFSASATSHIDEVGLSNQAMKGVLERLLLSKQGGKDRGFISYAELGINQLGAVYEGLMSYTGFFAEEDLHEVAKGGNAEKGSWVVPVSRSAGISEADFVREDGGDERAIVHERGSFVYRLAGRERQQSASFYTPEVLTRFVVSQALEELLDQDDRATPAADILSLTVCEPALGSGAFAIEATRQLAEEYLTRRQRELGERIDPDDYQRRLQEVKAYIALHQVYGVDLNSTAVELAEISLWLDTMVAGLSAPWFGLHLRRGNSLVGARRAVFTRAQVEQKAHLAATPMDVPLTELASNLTAGLVAEVTAGKIHHFLLPSEGWGATADAKEAKELAPEALARLKAWRKSIRTKPSKTQLDQLVELGYRVEALWQIALRRLQLAEEQIRRDIPVWGAEGLAVGGDVSREEIEASLNDPNGAYRRLRRVMDAWTALWFWPLTDHGVDGAAPPTLDEWIATCREILGRHVETNAAARRQGQVELTLAQTWRELDTLEQNDLGFASAQTLSDIERDHPWIQVTAAVASRQGFFHWELDFAAAFGRGGFDLQVGNPPWVKPAYDRDAIIAEIDPTRQLGGRLNLADHVKLTQKELHSDEISRAVVAASGIAAATVKFLRSSALFPDLHGASSDLYRSFMATCWRHGSRCSIVSLVHPSGHLTEKAAGNLRRSTYHRLARVFTFKNEMKLFPEIGNDVQFSVSVYTEYREVIDFFMVNGLYHPTTAESSLRHLGGGVVPGIKNDEGKWDLRAHSGRVVPVSEQEIRSWAAFKGLGSGRHDETPALFQISQDLSLAVRKLGSQESRVGAHPLTFHSGIAEESARQAGRIRRGWSKPSTMYDVVWQGPHIFVNDSAYKIPNASLASFRDWSNLDKMTLPADHVPYVTVSNNSSTPLTGRAYRIVWRRQVRIGRERSLVSSIVPVGTTHLDSLASLSLPGEDGLIVDIASTLSSLLSDYFIRILEPATLSQDIIQSIPFPDFGRLAADVRLRTLRLVSATNEYSGLWEKSWTPDFKAIHWTRHGLGDALGEVTPLWNPDVYLRKDLDRRQAQLEIDAIVALSLGVSIDELCTIYRTQFPVLYGYDKREYLYDANGRLVPNSVASMWRKKGDGISEDERTATNQAGNTYVYELPFVNLDREADMRQAYAHFERILEERS